MEATNPKKALSPSNSSRPYPTTTAPFDDLPHHGQHQQPPFGGARPARQLAHHPMPGAGGPGGSNALGSADNSLSMSAPSRRPNFGNNYDYETLVGYQEPAAGGVGERGGPHRHPSSSYRSHDFASGHQHQQHGVRYHHAYSSALMPASARVHSAYPSNPTASPPLPPPQQRKQFPSYSSARPPLPSGTTPTLPSYASPFSPIDRFHPSPYAPTVSSGPSPAQSAPHSAGLHDFHTVRGVTQTPNWQTQASYTPNSVFSSYPNTPAGVGASVGGVGSGGRAADAGHLSTRASTAGPTPAQHEHMGQQQVDGAANEGVDGDNDDFDVEGIPPGHVPVDAWGPQGPPAHVREMMRKRPLFDGGRVQPASPPKRYLSVERPGVDGDKQHRNVDMDGLVRSPVGSSGASAKGAASKAGGGFNSANTSDWTTSEHNEYDSESVTKGPLGTVRRAFTSTTHTVTHHHHHHHRSQDAQEHFLGPPSVGGSSTMANAATSDPLDVTSPTADERQQPHQHHQHLQSDMDVSEDDWSECKTTVTHKTTKRRAPQHHHPSRAHAHSHGHPVDQAPHGHAIGSPNAAVDEDSIPVAQDDEKRSFTHALAADTHGRTARSRDREREMPAPSPYYDGAIPPPPPLPQAYHMASSSTLGRRSGPAPPPGPGPAGPGSNSASVYFGNRRGGGGGGGYFDDDRLPPTGMGPASRAYWSDRERRMLMLDRDHAHADRDRYYSGYPPAPGAGQYSSPYPPPPPLLAPARGGQYDVEVRHMTAAEYPPRMPPPYPSASGLSPSMDEYERRTWAMGKPCDGLGDGADERDRVRYEGMPPVDTRLDRYRSFMPAGRGRYWGGGSPHEVYSSTSTRYHQHPAGYYRSYEEYMYEQREREYSSAMMDRGRGGYDRMDRGMMPQPPPPPPPAMPVGPSPPIMGLGRAEPSEWSAPRASDAPSEGPPPYDVGSWRGSPQRGRAVGRALGSVDSGHYGLRPDGWRHPSRLPPIHTRSTSAGSQTAHASASTSPHRQEKVARDDRLANNLSSGAHRPHPQSQPSSAAQAPAPSTSTAAVPHSLPDTPLLQLGPNMGTTSVGLAIMAAIDEGDIGKRRDYLTFTRATYTEMIECLRRPNEPLAPHITDRRRWKRLMNLLVEHPGQPTYQSLTWKQCPLWIIPHEDWDQLIWEYHYSNGQPGVAECNTVAKTARMLGRLYQTRRSRCGIFIEYIAQLLAMCPHCAGGEDGAKIISKAKGKITIGHQSQTQGGESEEAGATGQRPAPSTTAPAAATATASASHPSSQDADMAVLHSPHSPRDQQQQPALALAQQVPPTSPPAPAYLSFSYLPGLSIDPTHLAPDHVQQQPLSPPSSGASQRMLVDGESDGEIGSQQHDPLFSDPPPDPHVVFQDRRL
ncbi:hypothetical protein BCR44DRAFT_47280 [Catenaria anguillulae PL171]|uniref:Uncharacterized protein n=1 Tax=Catenaria anguillulae PL171 TaxID=765915 RepID=A0A1Y2HN68_9FUNG|nr:hypothetical protein BCR44DRAFT_47280 [Catenaria anguillulae PL171]